MNGVKSGITTSEFWLVIVNTVLMVLASLGMMSQAEVTEIKSLLVPFVGALIPILLYIWGRIKVKTS